MFSHFRVFDLIKHTFLQLRLFVFARFTSVPTARWIKRTFTTDHPIWFCSFHVRLVMSFFTDTCAGRVDRTMYWFLYIHTFMFRFFFSVNLVDILNCLSVSNFDWYGLIQLFLCCSCLMGRRYIGICESSLLWKLRYSLKCCFRISEIFLLKVSPIAIISYH